MRRLIFVTQAVDPAHPALAATIPKLRALARRVDEVVVLAQSAAAADLPGNVDVRAFGAPSRAGRLVHFERELARALPGDAVVAHMIPVYVLLAAPLVRPRRIPLVLWYTHWKASMQLRAAEKLATSIVSEEIQLGDFGAYLTELDRRVLLAAPVHPDGEVGTAPPSGHVFGAAQRAQEKHRLKQ